MRRNPQGASLVEYACLVALIATAGVIGFYFFGEQAGTTCWNIASNVAAAGRKIFGYG
jgi:Flp pilus assembly pilin Flp